MSDEYRIVKLSFHINIKTQSEQHWPNNGFQELQLKNVIEFGFNILYIYIYSFVWPFFEILNLIKANFDWWKALEKINYLLIETIS